jgi:NAD(P)-dependent dehydrogenase (short-subunit alcohol dehydrogenase family)
VAAPRSVLVTGASTGIGYAAALDLDRAGWRVFAGARSEADLGRLRAILSARSHALRLDVTSGADIAAARDLVAERTGGALDGLVNNAGIVVRGPFEALTGAALRRQFDVNLFGPADLTRELLPLLRAARGRIVNVGSISGRVTWPYNGPYAASKYALRALGDSLRLELLPLGVRVVLVEPGAIATPLWRKPVAPADYRLAELDSQTRERLERIMSIIEDAVARIEARAAPVATAARAIRRALEARAPRARYLLGADARVQTLWQAVPQPLRDRAVAFGIERMLAARARRRA